MSKWGSCDFSELKALQKRLQKATEKTDDFMLEVLYELANRTLRLTKKATPEDTGKLKGNWALGQVTRIGDELQIEIFNNTDYAQFVEFGHRLVRKGRTVGFRDGRLMLTVSLAEIERIMPQLIGQRTQEFMKKLLGG